jgi:hypothetical protein
MHDSDPSVSLVHESDAPEELLRVACVIDDYPVALELRRELLDLAQHRPPDPLPPQLARYDNVVHAERVVCDLERNDGDNVAEELAEQAPCRGVGRGLSLPVGVAGEERRDRFGVGGVDGSNVEAKSAQLSAFSRKSNSQMLY